ncbi:MAG: hypothetical protein V4719_22000 [Planctomycetota bacterium]
MMRIACLLSVLLCCGVLVAQDRTDTPGSDRVILKGDWGRLECIRTFEKIYLPGNKPRTELDDLPPQTARSLASTPIGSQFSKPQYPTVRICEIKVFDKNGESLKALDQDFHYLIEDKVQQVSVKSSNTKVAAIVSPVKIEVATAGKATISVRFIDESASFPVEVIRSKIHERMSSAQVVKAAGKPSLRYREFHGSSYEVGNTGVRRPGAKEFEVWRWEKQPELYVEIEVGTQGNFVKSVRSEKPLTDIQMKRIQDKGSVIDDSRAEKSTKPE